MLDGNKTYQISGENLNRLFHLIEILDVSSLYKDRVNNIISEVVEISFSKEEETFNYKPIHIGGFRFILYKPENVVTWESLKSRLGERYHDLCVWLDGQTTTPNGVYVWDVERFLDGLGVID